MINIMTKEFLVEQHIEQKKTVDEIAILVGCHKNTVIKRLKKFDIKFTWNRKHKRENLTDRRFGALIAKKYLYSNKNGRAIWECNCDCGVVIEANSKYLLSEEKTNCGQCNNFLCLPQFFFGFIETGARRRKINFDITREYAEKLFIEQKGECGLTKLKLFIPCNTGEHKQRRGDMASLDRIDNDKGYVEGNVRWVHRNVNMMKWILSDDVFVTLCGLVWENNNDRFDGETSLDFRWHQHDRNLRSTSAVKKRRERYRPSTT